MKKLLTFTAIPLLEIVPLCADVDSTTVADTQRQFEQRWRENQITPVANPKPDGNFNPYITADFIYWVAYEEGLSYAYNGVSNAPTPVPASAEKGKLLRPNFKWEPGFKVGLGNKFAHDGWDFYAQYTWLNSDADDNDDNNDCCPTEIVLAKTNYWVATAACPEAMLVGEAGTKWNLNSFNVLDLEFGRNFYISKFLTLRPFGGFKFSWQHQKYKVKYYDVMFVGDQYNTPSSDLTIPVPSNVKLDLKQREFGVGFRMGMNTEWYFCKWLGGYSNFAMTGMWNRFHQSREAEVNDISTGVEYVSENIKDKIFDVTAVLEIGLGLFFEWAFSDDHYMFSLVAGWETQVWFNQNNFIFLMANNAPGNLAFQGFTLKAGFAF
jgi:hypothetical protein